MAIKYLQKKKTNKKTGQYYDSSRIRKRQREGKVEDELVYNS